MSSAIIRFDQDGVIGTNNRSREDIQAGLVVTINSMDPGAVETCELLWRPPEDDTAAITGSGPWSITPKTGTWGTYRVKLTVDGDVMIKTFDVPDPVTGLPELAAGEIADPTASLIKNTSTEIEASDTNAAFGPFTSGSAFGWWHKLRRWFRRLSATTLNPTAVKTANYTALPGQLVPFDPSGGTFTLKAPASPSIGDLFAVAESAKSALGITVDGNGEDIEKATDLGSLVSSFTLDGAAGAVVIWQYMPQATGNAWIIIGLKEVPA